MAWDRFEEGKMNAIAKDILTGTIASDDYEKKRTTVAKNTAAYIQEENAGHTRYGYGYLFAQVNAIQGDPGDPFESVTFAAARVESV